MHHRTASARISCSIPIDLKATAAARQSKSAAAISSSKQEQCIPSATHSEAGVSSSPPKTHQPQNAHTTHTAAIRQCRRSPVDRQPAGADCSRWLLRRRRPSGRWVAAPSLGRGAWMTMTTMMIQGRGACCPYAIRSNSNTHTPALSHDHVHPLTQTAAALPPAPAVEPPAPRCCTPRPRRWAGARRGSGITCTSGRPRRSWRP